VGRYRAQGRGDSSAAHRPLKQPDTFPRSTCFSPPQYERSVLLEPETGSEFELRTWTRNNITETLNSLNVNTVDDIQQISAALAQCTVCSPSPPPASSSRGSSDALQFLFCFAVSLSHAHTTQGGQVSLADIVKVSVVMS